MPKMSTKDAVNFLNVNENASEEEIKKAYKALSLKYHPDRKGGDSEKFLKLTEAYELLSKKDTSSSSDQNPSSSFDDMYASFFSSLNATKQDYVDAIKELLKASGLDNVTNLSRIVAIDEEQTVEFLGYSLNNLFEHDCLNQESLSTILEHLNAPRDKYSASNPYAYQIILHNFFDKNGLTPPSDISLENTEKMLKALIRLSGGEDSGDLGWLQPFPNLLNQENVNLLCAHPGDAENIARLLTRLEHVGLLSNDNKTFCINYLNQTGSDTFDSLTYNLLGKNKISCEKILSDAHIYLDRKMQPRTQVTPQRSEAELINSRKIMDGFKENVRHVHGINKLNQTPFQEFTDKVHKQWINGNSGVTNDHLSVLKNAFDEGLLNESDLKASPIVLYSLAGLSLSGIGTGHGFNDSLSRTKPDRFDILREGLLTVKELEDICKIQLKPYQTGALDTILSDEGLDALRMGIPIVSKAQEAANMNLGAIAFSRQVKELVADNPRNKL